MKKTFVLKWSFLFGLLLFGQSALAVLYCTDTSILPLLTDYEKKDLQRVVKEYDDDKGVCIYVKSLHKTQSHYVYTLLDYSNKVVYCGITDDPVRRYHEHVQIKNFKKMISVGYFSEDVARDKEKMCVCEYDPYYNKRPQCDSAMTGGGLPYFFYGDYIIE